MTVFVTSNGPWRAAVAIELSAWAFEPVGWLEETVITSGRPSKSGAIATVELERAAGGMSPKALLGGTFESHSASSLSLRVASSGVMAPAAGHPPSRRGLLGAALLSGIPDEFASAVLRGLNKMPELNRSGAISVSAGGYDPVDSSEYAFECAAGLLKWVLLTNQERELSELDLAAFLELAIHA